MTSDTPKPKDHAGQWDERLAGYALAAILATACLLALAVTATAVYLVVVGRITVGARIGGTIPATWLFAVVAGALALVVYGFAAKFFGRGFVSYVVDRIASVADSYQRGDR